MTQNEFDRINATLDRIEARMDDMKSKLDRLRKELDEYDSKPSNRTISTTYDGEIMFKYKRDKNDK
jgi:prefoldin subunit 5